MNEQGKLLIENAKKHILSDKQNPNRIENITNAMNAVYKYYKKIIKEPNFRDERLLEIFSLERLLENEFLPLKTEPYYDESEELLMPKEIITEENCKEALNYIIHETRKELSKRNDLKTSPLTAKCIDTSYFVEELCNKLGISQTRYCCNEDLSNGIFHCFNIISFTIKNKETDLPETKSFIVDCTYRQFFTYSNSFLERIGLMLNSGCCMGTYMLMDETRKNMAEDLLKNGYIEFNPDNIKNYFDGFVFEGRNGKYYESLEKDIINKNDYVPEYSYEDYLIALNNGGLTNENFMGRMRIPLDKEIIFDLNEYIESKKI